MMMGTVPLQGENWIETGFSDERMPILRIPVTEFLRSNRSQVDQTYAIRVVSKQELLNCTRDPESGLKR